jgi:hypothetical protein
MAVLIIIIYVLALWLSTWIHTTYLKLDVGVAMQRSLPIITLLGIIFVLLVALVRLTIAL